MNDCNNGADNVPGVMWMAAEVVETGMCVDGEAGWQERSGMPHLCDRRVDVSAIFAASYLVPVNNRLRFA